jgi:quercetin dioxygenase-like cupin family protein
VATSIPDLLGEVDIPRDGTLSRVVHKNDRIRLVVFAFDTDQELTEHRSASAAIVQVPQGRIDFTVAGETHEMDPSSWLYMDPDESHSLVAREPSILVLTLLKN